MVQSDWVKTGLLYVDMVAACVSHYKKQVWHTRKSLKTIYLNCKGYNQFVDWAKANMTEEDADSVIKSFTFDGVEVKLNSRFMGEQIYFDFNEEKQMAQS